MMLPTTIFCLFQQFVIVVLHPLQIHIWSSFSHVHVLPLPLQLLLRKIDTACCWYIKYVSDLLRGECRVIAPNLLEPGGEGGMIIEIAVARD